MKDNPKRDYKKVHNLGLLVWPWMKRQRDQGKYKSFQLFKSSLSLPFGSCLPNPK